MKYFFDTEFITGFKKPMPFLPTIGNWNKPEFYIHLVSIGMVDESGREYYAISNEFNPKLADDWVKNNVLKSLSTQTGYTNRLIFGKKFIFGEDTKSNQQIKMEIIEFMGGGIGSDQADYLYVPEGTEVYAYFADYDWVVFCSLFGRIIDLPSGMPMYCRDLKQTLDEKEESFPLSNGIRGQRGYPKQENEHNALDDAKGNKKLYEFISNAL